MWVGVVGAIAGAIFGGGLTLVGSIFTERRRDSRDLKVAANACLDRLHKIRYAVSSKKNKQKHEEIFRLGSDLDRYRDCIAVSSQKAWKLHNSIFGKI